jgi:hypothetical protein
MTSRYFLLVAMAAGLLCSYSQAQTDVFTMMQEGEVQQDLDDQDGGLPGLGADRPQQSFVVREDRAGWRAAGTGLAKGRLSDKLRANWVMVDSNGLLRGTVIGFNSAPVGDVTVNLIQDGQVVNTTRVNDQGQFSFNNVQQGTYGLVGFGSESFFAFGFDAIRNSDNPRAIAPQSLTVMAAPNQTNINTDWIAFFGPKVKYRVYGVFESREGTEDPERLYGTDGISTHYPEAFPSTSIQSHAVTTLSDGRLIGRVHQIDSINGRPVDVRNTRVMLLRNNDVYAATSTDNFGVFAFTRIEPGYYSLVAAGDDGVAAIGLEVVNAAGADPAVPFEDEAGSKDDDEQIVPIDIALLPSESTGWLLSYANEAAYQRVLQISAKANAQRDNCNCPPMSPAELDNIVRALTPSQRGRFWKRLNTYFDEIFYGQNSGQGNAPMPNAGQAAQPYYQPAGYAPAYPPQSYAAPPAPMMQRSVPRATGYQPMQVPTVPSETILRPVPATPRAVPGVLETAPRSIEPVPRSSGGNDTTFYQRPQFQPPVYQQQRTVPGYQTGYRFSDQ